MQVFNESFEVKVIPQRKEEELTTKKDIFQSSYRARNSKSKHTQKEQPRTELKT